MLLGLPVVLEFLILVASAVTAITILWKFVVKPVARFVKRLNSGMDTLLGYPEVTDPGSGTVLKEPTPPLAHRVEQVETAVLLLTETNERMMRLEQAHQEHVAFAEGWKAGLESRVAAIEAGGSVQINVGSDKDQR